MRLRGLGWLFCTLIAGCIFDEPIADDAGYQHDSFVPDESPIDWAPIDSSDSSWGNGRQDATLVEPCRGSGDGALGESDCDVMDAGPLDQALGQPECDNGIDDDGDGRVDYPEDPGCGSRGDHDERDELVGRSACDNGLDDDGDNWVDLADPGCASEDDPDETNPPDVPRCANRADDDDDGQTDFPHDPGCAAAGDDDERDLPQAPVCGNGLDDDADGQVDYPNDPGCQGRGDPNESDPALEPICSDGRDNDGDGATDFPEDWRCTSAAGHSEREVCGVERDVHDLSDGQRHEGVLVAGPDAVGSCSIPGMADVVFRYQVTGVFDSLAVTVEPSLDAVGTTIYVRRACVDRPPGGPVGDLACARAEALDSGVSVTLPQPELGDYFIYIEGRQNTPFTVTARETPIPSCRNGMDDDVDGRTDFPSDPGCVGPEDADERDGDPPSQCGDGLDNDEDGSIDFPADVGCLYAADWSEVDVCGPNIIAQPYLPGMAFIDGVTADGTRRFEGTCATGGPEQIVVYRNTINAALTVSVDHAETVGRTSLHVRTSCLDVESELGCDASGDEDPDDHRGRLVIDQAPPGDYYIIVDTEFGLGGRFRLTVDAEPLGPGCDDGLDNDGDGFIDGDDPQCSGLDDEGEALEPGQPAGGACADAIDNDGDGSIDFPWDPGCEARGDPDEADPDQAPACANGVDDDENGSVDFPADPGCQSRADPNEAAGQHEPRCSNSIDDDGDGATDYPFDSGCAGRGDQSEASHGEAPAACANGRDDDGDERIDFPFDESCLSAGHDAESAAGEPAACSNQADDDQDGLVDFPFDPGCRFAADDDESDPIRPSACANGLDDDEDGGIDFPDDRGCAFAADRDERERVIAEPRCANSVDDDGDGLVDRWDPGCAHRDDDDEVDPDVQPLCANGIDDDDDGQVDFPADPGCEARGDDRESQACLDGIVADNLGEGHFDRMSPDDTDDFSSMCGGRDRPDHVLWFVLDERGDVAVRVRDEVTELPLTLAVTRDCASPRAVLSCVGGAVHPERVLRLPDAEPSMYYVIVDGVSPERWSSSGEPLALPPDPGRFQARDDIEANGWVDGGQDTFDRYGEFALTIDRRRHVLDVGLGQRVLELDDLRIHVTSEFMGNLWRVQIDAEGLQDAQELDAILEVTGTLGSGRNTIAETPALRFMAREVRYLITRDSRGERPSVVHLLVPGDPQRLPRIGYEEFDGRILITAPRVTLPITFYSAVSYADDQGLREIAELLTSDLRVFGGGGAPDAPAFGRYLVDIEVNEPGAQADPGGN